MKLLYLTALLFVTGITLFSCSEDENIYDPYANWPARNSEFYANVADSARTAIAQAKQQYGDDWEQHCEWRMYKSTTKSPSYEGSYTDSVCVHIFKQGSGVESPQWSDTVMVHYRGYLIPTQKMQNGTLTEPAYSVFAQSYLGDFNPEVAVPVKMSVSSTVAGFATALQHMHVGDSWLIYIPSELGYGSQQQTSLPSYSTLIYHVEMENFYPIGESVPEWHSEMLQ